MKVAVVGSRSFFDATLLKNTLAGIEISSIVSGGATGADSLAQAYGASRGIPVKIILPDYPRYGRGAPLHRNEQIVAECDTVIAFWNGKSRGTKHTINIAEKLGKPTVIISF